MQKPALGAFSRGRDCGTTPESDASGWRKRAAGLWLSHTTPESEGVFCGVDKSGANSSPFLPWGPSLSSLGLQCHCRWCREINHSFLLYCLYANPLNKSGLRTLESWLSCLVAAGTMEETTRDTTEAERGEWKYPSFSPSPAL